jgi:hypothetical protein
MPVLVWPPRLAAAVRLVSLALSASRFAALVSRQKVLAAAQPVLRREAPTSSQSPAAAAWQAAPHAKAVFYQAGASLEPAQAQLLAAPSSAIPFAKDAMLTELSPALARFHPVPLAVWPTVASGRVCARLVNLPRA